MPRPIRHRRPRRKPDVSVAFAANIAIRMLLLLSVVAAPSLLPLSAMAAFQSATTGAAAPVISAIGISVAHVPPHDLLLTNHTFRIDLECTALRIMLLFGMTVAVTPVKPKRRVQGLLIGIPAIAAANLIRLLGLAGVSEMWPEYFHVLHTYTFQAFMILFTGGAWALWLSASRNDWLPGWR